jgi:BASS family bile acid:Na+ symporter
LPIDSTVPAQLLTIVAAATIFTVMYDIGLGVPLGEFRWAWGHPGSLARALFAVLIAVPALALMVGRALDLPREAEIGIVLMAISPGAPVALRRSLSAGGHHSFAPALQILLALLAVVSMPSWIAVLNEVYAGHASISPAHVAKQVFVAQLLPLTLGIVTRRALPVHAARFEPMLNRVGAALLLLLLVLALVAVWRVVFDAGPRVALAVVVTTMLAVAVGHVLGGPAPGTRTAVAISSAARNAGLALLVATLNNASPTISKTVLVYLVLSAFTLIPYVVWRRRVRGAASGEPPAEANGEPIPRSR